MLVARLQASCNDIPYESLLLSMNGLGQDAMLYAKVIFLDLLWSNEKACSNDSSASLAPSFTKVSLALSLSNLRGPALEEEQRLWD